MKPRSIALRMSLMFALVGLLVFAVVGTGLFVVLRMQMDRHLREALDDRIEIARVIVSHTPTRAKWKFTHEKLTDMSPHDGSTRYAVISPDPAFTFGTPEAGAVAASAGPSLSDTAGYAQWRVTTNAHDMLTQTVAIPASGERPEVQLEVSVSDAINARTMRSFGLALAALSALGSVAVLLLGYYVTRIGLAPLTRLTKEASEISPNNRAQRLNADFLPYELNDLAISFNGALERLETAYERLESFNADVAHELRTPVTILIGQTEVALTRKRSESDLRQTLQSNLEEFGRMREIINDMLFLARADQGELATQLVELSLASEVAHTLEFLELPLEEAHVSATLTGDARALVNRSLFGRALTNLVENAMRHCEPGASISVSITKAEGQIRVAVSNPGEPISPAVINYLFDRFYRAEYARTNSRENHGLGLAIVKAVADMHRGKVQAISENGVNTFSFSIAADLRALAAKPALPQVDLGSDNPAPRPVAANSISRVA